MQVLTDEKGFVTSFALVGTLVDGQEVNEPKDIPHFEQNFSAYRIRDGNLSFVEEQADALSKEAKAADLRHLRETECFSVINRGQLWYEGLSIQQLLELRKWYKAWLNVTETEVMPEKPAWLT